jgi:hypothetical protein
LTDSAKIQLDLVTRHAESGWAGFRSTLLGAAHTLGAEVAANRLAYYEVAANRLAYYEVAANRLAYYEVAANRLAYYEAKQALTKAIRDAGHVPNADDRRWIDQGLWDGTRVETSADPREDFGRMARDLWAEGGTFACWEDLSFEVKERFMRIGKAIYDAGFHAGADSIGVRA